MLIMHTRKRKSKNENGNTAVRSLHTNIQFLFLMLCQYTYTHISNEIWKTYAFYSLYKNRSKSQIADGSKKKQIRLIYFSELILLRDIQ